MQIILLSGGFGTRLWPLSNDARSKQFLRVLDVDDTDELESMVQRVQRQLHALKAISFLSFIEVQSESNLIEEDIERFPYEWLD